MKTKQIKTKTLKIKNKLSEVSSIEVQTTAPIWKDTALRQQLQQAIIRRLPAGHLNLEQGYELPDGIGRSVRAAVFGVEYKCKHRVYGDESVFTYDMFGIEK